MASQKKIEPGSSPLRDGAGHLDPQKAAKLRALSGEAVHDPQQAGFLIKGRTDALAEELATEFVESANSGEHEGEDVQDEMTEEEQGGPFQETSGDTEFAGGTDASNPAEATREPFPKV